MDKNIPLSVPNLSLDIVDNLRECIETGWVSTGGRFIADFENKVASYVGVKNAVGVQSGTGALHIALKILGVESGDEVIVPTVTFIAAVNPVKYLGANPIFMDCDDSLCMDIHKLEEFLGSECVRTDAGLKNKQTGRIIKAIVIVHVFGNMADMEAIMDLAEKYELKVLEDSTEALGSYFTEGRYQGKFAGTIGHVGCYSFNANKIITTGGGGMLVSNDSSLLKQVRYLSTQAKNDELYFIHDEVGFNYRMLNIQAALGTEQIEKLEGFIAIKIQNYNIYKEAIDKIDGLSLLAFRAGTRANHWFYSVMVDEKKYDMNRDGLLRKLNNNNIQSRPLWGLIHKQKPYRNQQAYKIEKALDFEQRLLNIPCSTNLKPEDVFYVIDKLRI